MNHLWLVTGGSRSGKSRYALELGKDASNPHYIATAWAGDAEMAERIQKHRRERGPQWTTLETRTDLPSAIRQALSNQADFILVDCLTLWVSNLMAESCCVERAAIELAESLPDSVTTVLVTNEVGSGIVPENAMARAFRDDAGRVNQILSASVGNVVLTVSGIPVKIK
jgi:adenosylcobinamide kinase/adenosylcobinamide-phosphate guanylyltransferase